MSRVTMVAALLGMGLALPDSATTRAEVDGSAAAVSQSPGGGSPGVVDPGDPEETIGAPFSVESIDRADRLLIVRNPNGSRTTIRVVPTAVEFDTVQVGDRVLLDYYPSSLVALGPPETAAAAGDQTPTRANAPVLGPAGAGQITAEARVSDADGKSGTLGITTIGGNPHQLTALDPATWGRLRSLHEGDPVTVTYTEAVAVGVHDASGR